MIDRNQFRWQFRFAESHAGRILTYFAAAVFTFAVFSAASAGEYEEGEAALLRSDFPTAMRLLLPLARQGDAAAQFYLSKIYRFGWGLSIAEPKEELLWLNKAIVQGNADAEDRMGEIYYFGEYSFNISQDFSKAFYWYHRAAEHGSASAAFWLGSMYQWSRGVTQDYAQARHWYRKAAEQGNEPAGYALAKILAEGDVQDFNESAFWYEKAAQKGDALAQGALSKLYADGLGVTQNYERAYFWANLSAAREVGKFREAAVKVRDEMATKMTPAQLAEAQRKASEWKPTPSEIEKPESFHRAEAPR